MSSSRSQQRPPRRAPRDVAAPEPLRGRPAVADVVVVGAGPAGCVMARRLAEAGADVVLLEAGERRASARAGLLDVGPGSRVVSRHPATLGGAPLLLPRGRTLGGSGAVNGGYCVAARPSDLTAWGPDWPRRYAVGLARAAERLRPRLVPAGPVAASLSAAFPTRVSAVAQAIRGGRRVTAFDAWDPGRAGVRVVTGAPVRELRWAGGRPGGRCDGVVLDDDHEIAARRVVLCAGTIGTATLLLDSGIGPGSGHPVGRAVQEHPEVLLDLPAGFVPEVVPVAGASAGLPRPGALPPLLSHVVRLELPGASGTAEVEVRPYAVPLHRVIPGLDPQPGRLGIALMTPLGRGAIVVGDSGAPGDPGAPSGGPAGRGGSGGPGGGGGVGGPHDGVRVDLADDPRDAAVLDAAAAVVADRLGLPVPLAGWGAASPSTSQHLAGSAPMGSVVDEAGRVLGAEGLHVADASVFPSLPRCGPYYSVLAVAEALAAVVVADPAW